MWNLEESGPEENGYLNRGMPEEPKFWQFFYVKLNVVKPRYKARG